MNIENTLDSTSSAIKIVIAAEAGNGKTTLAATIKEKTLVISAEAGLLSLRGKNVDYVELQKYKNAEGVEVLVQKADRIKRLIEIYQYVLKPETMAKYDWLFIDSLSEINQNMLEFIESQEEFQGPKNTIKKFGELSSRMRSLCKSFRDLPHYNVAFSALVKSETDNDNRVLMKIDMTGKFAEVLPSLFDEILYLGVTNEIGEDGRNIRQILTQKTDRITFPKDRSGRLARIEPADLGLIAEKIRKQPVIENISEKAKAAAAEAKAIKATEEPKEAVTETEGAKANV